MTSQRGDHARTGGRGHALLLSRRNSRRSRSPNTDDDSENSRCPSPLLTIEGGYRIDPFLQYPVSKASKGVKFMTDYYIQVWAPQQAQAVSLQHGGNALLTVVLPLAMQNSMLFQATIAMTRAAWVLKRGSDAFADKMLLRHRGSAMLELRNALVESGRAGKDLVLLTMSTLLTLNPSYATRINEPGHRISTLTYPGLPFPADLCTVVAKLPEGFGEVALSRNIAVEFMSFLVKLTELIDYISSAPDRNISVARPEMTMQRAIYDLQCLSALPLTGMEAQMARGLLAFLLHLYNQMSFHIPLARPLRPILEAFNEHPEIPQNYWLQRCLLWCSMVIASAWDAQIDASPQNHVILDRLISRMSEGRSWESLGENMRKFYLDDHLADEWEVCWRAAVFRIGRHRRGASQISSFSRLLIKSSRSSETEISDDHV
ncbi:hypothetical protein LTR10_016753 [Elasticomyces elasticus]|uniref:Transcription factor domain-containing protein n=1 Tax=Exophiala sideris TaxID=1016849 RepID=A0ABR0JMU4_9EURO|nr:hypothetical protein LTR10_016753 [Elasticomyces elasticus]KAK5037757.1 hypothetical protein LTS07_001224 [Exophiala sideris]KAK5043739.1 hypothetical protein LTR13_000093 [Exophiala sideris]KAK5067238.1 hypothetical protein LTR69_001225 [Exophiala sideris]KAK5182571.1 hypothetical protein LTR44_004962 [Eurotiomycetes sp. CCFEE 6388]